MIVLLLKVLMGASFIGCSASLMALLLGVSGYQVMPVWYAAAFIASGVATLIGVFVLQMFVQNKFGRRQLKQVLLQGAPRWIQQVSISLSLTGFALAVGLGFTGHEPPPNGLSNLLAGAFGLFLFPAGFVSFLSFSRRRTAINRRCSRGHELPLRANFCPECGQDVQELG